MTFLTSPFQRFAGLLLGMHLLTGCDDPKREADLRWREEEVNAKDASMALREKQVQEKLREVDVERLRIKEQEAKLAMAEQALAKRQEETAKLQLELQKAKTEYETKARRGPAPSTTAARVLVIDPDLIDVPLFERASDRKGAIASTTKLMTALILAEAGDLDKLVTIEQSDTECAPVRMGLKAGETYTRRNLLTALMVKSSNDIAQALARDNAGSVAAFVVKMNARAKEMGCKDTLFINPNGLPPVDNQPDPYSTAIDLARISVACDKIQDIRDMVKLKSYFFEKPDGKKIPLENTNRVLRTSGYCDGMKTGFTNAAGYCLVASGQRDGRRRIVVILNGTRDGVWKDAQNLLEWSLKS